jgi:phospholipid/cholesterol/gamma-HCH transport system substrate-binding protein
VSPPPNFRHVSRKAGIMVAAGCAIALGALVLAGRAQGWFGIFPKLTILLPEEGSYGLKDGSEVQILGIVIGQVTDVRISPDRQMEAVLKISKPDFLRIINRGSGVLIKKKYGIAGDPFIEITRGGGPPIDPEKDVLRAFPDKEILALIEEFVKKIEERILPTLEKIPPLIEGHVELVGYINRPDGPFRKLLERLDRATAQIEDLTAQIARGEGTIGHLLQDKDLEEKVRKMAAQLAESIDHVHAILGSVREDLVVDVAGIASDLKVVTAAAREESGDLSGTVLQIQDLLRQVNRLIVGLQRHWLIRGYVPPDISGGRIPAEDVSLRGGR